MGVLLPAMSLLPPASPGLDPLEGPEHLAWPLCQPAALGQVHLCLGGGVAGALLSWAGQQGFQTPTLKATRGTQAHLGSTEHTGSTSSCKDDTEPGCTPGLSVQQALLGASAPPHPLALPQQRHAPARDKQFS